MAKKNSTDKIKDLQKQMKKLDQQIKEQERKRDEELGKIFREQWGIEDCETAKLIIDTLKSEVESLKQSTKTNEVNEPINTLTPIPDESDKKETVVSSS